MSNKAILNYVEVPKVDVAEATNELFQRLKKQEATSFGETDVDIGYIAIQFLLSRGFSADRANSRSMQVTPQFLDAAWELVRNGVLRPGRRAYSNLQTESSDKWFCVTEYGKRWLETVESENFIPVDLSSFTTIIEKYRKQFGEGYMQRAVEAYRCFKSGSWLGCCAMSGAAAESILLALAVKKTGDENEVLKKYRSASGRQKVKDLLLGGKNEGVRREFEGLLYLLGSWRDDAAHGTALSIGKAEADNALLLLMRAAKYSADNYALLTTDGK